MGRRRRKWRRKKEENTKTTEQPHLHGAGNTTENPVTTVSGTLFAMTPDISLEPKIPNDIRFTHKPKYICIEHYPL